MNKKLVYNAVDVRVLLFYNSKLGMFVSIK